MASAYAIVGIHNRPAGLTQGGLQSEASAAMQVPTVMPEWARHYGLVLWADGTRLVTATGGR